MIVKLCLRVLMAISLVFFAGCSDNAANGDVDGGQDLDGVDGSSAGDGEDGSQTGDDVQQTDGGTFSDQFEECAAVTELATNTRGPADVIIAVDNTPSMYNEIEEVRANLNHFSQMVQDDGLDLHIILISCLTEDCLNSNNWHTICIDPPVGAEGACQPGANTDDSTDHEYLHVNSKVESRKGLESIVDTHDQWGFMLRDNAAKHVVMVSDDNDDWTADQFMTTFVALDPRLSGFQFHAIFAYLSKEPACLIGPQEPCCTYSAPDGEGTIYRELVNLTGGVSGDMCLQDFDPVFEQLAGAVIASARLNCLWVIPDPPEGETFESDLVNVEFLDGEGGRFRIGRVESEAACTGVEHGWYFDDPDDPTVIEVCPQTCEWFQGKIGAQIEVQFGCETWWEPVD